MGQLPCTGDSKNSKLDQHPSNDAGVCALGLVTEFGLAFLWKRVPSLVCAMLHVFRPKDQHTLWKTCSLLMSFRRALRSLTRVAKSLSFSLSELSITLVSPMATSSVSRIPPLGEERDIQLFFPLVDDGVKQILWSPASAAVKVNLPVVPPRWETTRCSLSNISYRPAR